MGDRTKKSVKNVVTGVCGQLICFVVTFLSRRVFVILLSEDYLGLSGLFSNVLSVLSLAELGVGTAIVYSLYRPLSENNHAEIKSLMRLFKRFYIAIGVFILAVGLSLIPFLDVLVKEMPDLPHIGLIYALFVVDSAASYFFSYKKSLISADQKRYIVSLYRYSLFVCKTLVQIGILLVTRNYLLYLCSSVCFTILENLLISRRANVLYPYLKESNIEKLSPNVTQTIKKNVVAMMGHKLGGVVVNSTDNLLIAKLVDVRTVGLYSNYLMITTAVRTVYGVALQAITASFGNLNVSSEDDHKKSVFEKINFACAWIYGWSAICLLSLFQPFISLWVGEKMLLSPTTVYWITAAFYVTGMREASLLARSAMGLYWNDRYKPLFESIINLVVSIVLGKRYGIDGILMGTFASTMTTCFWVEPLMLYRHGFHTKVGNYFARYGIYTLVTLCGFFVTGFALSFLSDEVTILSFVFRTLACLFVPNLFFLLVYHRSEDFHYYWSLAQSLIRKRFAKSVG